MSDSIITQAVAVYGPPAAVAPYGSGGEQAEGYAAVARLALDAVQSPATRRVYRRALENFFAWREAAGRPAFTRAAVQRHRAAMQEAGLSPATVNQRLAAIRLLAREAAANGLLPGEEAAAIGQVPGVKQTGVRMGVWLTRQEAQQLLDSPPANTLKGLRDRAALGLLVACGLRRAELCALTVEHFQQRDGRWVILDLRGKGGRIRTVPVPPGVKERVDNWLAAAGVETGRVMRSMRSSSQGGQLRHDSLSEDAVHKLVAEYALGKVRPHDLRRTCAKLCRKSGGELEQVQLLLGHASIATTERYLGTQLDLENACNDRLGLNFCD